jgi:cell division septal protein FtsQ
MHKDRCRRYRSASEMADDIRNYLNGLPLIAGPDSAMYRLGKFIRRHKVLVIAVLSLVVGLTIGLIVTLCMYISFQRALDVIFNH